MPTIPPVETYLQRAADRLVAERILRLEGMVRTRTELVVVLLAANVLQAILLWIRA